MSHLNAFFFAIILCAFAVFNLLEAKSKISLGKCHIELENIWVIFKYLLILISSIIPQ